MIVPRLSQLPSPKSMVRVGFPVGVSSTTPSVIQLQLISRMIGVVMLAVNACPLRSVPLFDPRTSMICVLEELELPEIQVTVLLVFQSISHGVAPPLLQ